MTALTLAHPQGELPLACPAGSPRSLCLLLCLKDNVCMLTLQPCVTLLFTHHTVVTESEPVTRIECCCCRFPAVRQSKSTILSHQLEVDDGHACCLRGEYRCYIPMLTFQVPYTAFWLYEQSCASLQTLLPAKYSELSGFL